jgi:hypothetical protein
MLLLSLEWCLFLLQIKKITLTADRTKKTPIGTATSTASNEDELLEESIGSGS